MSEGLCPLVCAAPASLSSCAILEELLQAHGMATGSTHHRWVPPELESETYMSVQGVGGGWLITGNTGMEGGSERDGQKLRKGFVVK